MIKAAFLDIDGTLVSFKTHRMPESTKRAIAELHRHGVLCFVASGRPKYQLQPCMRSGFEGFPGFDGVVTMNGSCCFDDGGVYFECPLDPADVATVVSQVEDGLYDALALERDRAYVSGHSAAVRAVERNAGLVYEEGDIRQALDAHVYQFCAFLPPEREHILTDACSHVMATRWIEYFCDVVPKGGSKSAGIRETLRRRGIAPEEAVAFGDGGNDADMLAFCGTGVAMGNATDEAKAAADYVTSSVDEDGVWNACRHLGLIG